tara:strand:- start:3761 stop:4468 length:708 start_codon:yes stop_codon:yes gene_type:complete
MKKSQNEIKNPKEKYFLIDICGTYVRENTTFGLIKKHFPKNTFKGIYIRIFLNKYSPFRIFVLCLEKITKKDILKKILISSIRGVKVSSLNITATNYAKELIFKRNKVDYLVNHYIQKYKKKCKPIFASSSIEPIVKKISSLEKIPFISSQLEVNGDTYTGRICSDIKGQKKSEIYKKFNINLDESKYFLITDNKTDFNMFNNSLLTIFIVRGKKKPFQKSIMANKKIKFIYLKN